MTRLFPVLTFHALEENSSVISFSPSVFERGLAKLQDAGYRTMTLPDVAEHVRRSQPFPDHCFAITFDDGYASVYSEAFPVLQSFRMSATVFLTVGERQPPMPESRLPPFNGRSMLSWREICEMQSGGMNFGAHTLTHPNLTRLPRDRADSEMSVSKAVIEDALGAPVRSFAYPYGFYDDESIRLAQKYFDCACSANLGFVTPRSDLYALERLDAYYLRSDILFDLTLSRFFGVYISVRGLMRRARGFLFPHPD
jgi:peptidoglycan/xylan/chitin deacetylase (PgdA/CDA1 family)